MDHEMEVMEDLVVDECSFSEFFDPDYEFDACQFFDFSKEETDYEAQEAQRWFRYAHEYPPSPFVVKLKMMKASKAIPLKLQSTSFQKQEADENASTSSCSDDDIDREVPSTEVKGPKHHNLIAQESGKAKSKSELKSSKPSSSTFMKPTASHLAKQNKACDLHADGHGRFQKSLVKADERSPTPIGSETSHTATKRQKLEIGYLRKLLIVKEPAKVLGLMNRKEINVIDVDGANWFFSPKEPKLQVAQLKHRTSFSHKIAKKVAQLEASSSFKSKTTIPRRPELVTEERAQRRRSQGKCDSGQQPKVKSFKARPLNRKILEAPSLPLRKKSMPQLPEFQVFHFKTTERALQHQSANALNTQNPISSMQSEDMAFRRQNSGNSAKKENGGSPNKLKACTTDKVYPIKNGDFILNIKQDSDLPPVELFQKLSLKSELETKSISVLKPHRPTKVSKENAPRALQQEFWRSGGKPDHCGSDRRIPEVGSQQNINRSVDIR